MSSAFEEDEWGEDIDWDYEKSYNFHKKEFILWPKQWQTYTDSHEWEILKLVEDNKTRVPDTSGIYSLILKPDIANHVACSYLMYIGKAQPLKKRFSDYLGLERGKSGRKKMRRFLLMYKDNIYFCYTQLEEKELNLVEDKLLQAYIPPINEELKGSPGEAKKAW